MPTIFDKNTKKDGTEQLNNLARGSGRILLDIKAVFPFDFFPDEIVMDETKVSIHTKYFFYTKEVISIEYKDIFNVLIQQGLFFAKLEITGRFFTQKPIVVEFLRRNDAIHARRIIQGMIIVKKENIPIASLPLEDVIKKLDQIGRTR